MLFNAQSADGLRNQLPLNLIFTKLVAFGMLPNASGSDSVGVSVGTAKYEKYLVKTF